VEIKTTKVLIVGRGTSIKHFSWNSLSTVTTIGLNITSYAGKLFNYSFTSNELYDLYSKELERRPLLVGSVYFSLGMLVDLIQTKAKGVFEIGLIGFDFDGYSPDDDIEKYVVNSDLQRRIDIHSQSEAYKLFKGKYPELKIVRFGFDRLSDLDPRFGWKNNFVQKASRQVEIVAEITTNHHGSTEKLEKLIEGAYRAGADTIKLQKRDVDSFYSKDRLRESYSSPFGKTFRDYRLALELSDEQVRIAEELVNERGMRLFFSTLDLKSYKWIIGKGYNRVKLPSTISRKTEFIKFVAKNPPKEVVISTGMTDITYESWLIKHFNEVEKLYLLQCTSSYPTFYKDVNIGVVKHYQDLSHVYKNIIPGLSSHDIGSLGSCMAIAAGARMLEKHIKTGITDWSHFDDTALDVNTSFADFCRDVRSAEYIYGNEVKSVLESEHHKY